MEAAIIDPVYTAATAHLSAEVLDFLTAGPLEAQLHKIISCISHKALQPPPHLIFRAFELCPHIRVVLMGQDPYPRGADGLSFSKQSGKVIGKQATSLRNMYACLLYHNLITQIPNHNDLSSWATQGVLLLNCALTTVTGSSNAHQNYWYTYTDALIAKIGSADADPIVFILLGKFAHDKQTLINAKHHILKWGHPSNLNNYNRTDNPQNFKYANVFVNANIILGERAIDWNSVNALIPQPSAPHPVSIIPQVPTSRPIISTSQTSTSQTSILQASTSQSSTSQTPIPQLSISQPSISIGTADVRDDTLYIFTDGAATGNGKATCRASWAFCALYGKTHIDDHGTIVSQKGIVEPAIIGTTTIAPTNNRGELLAIARALMYLQTLQPLPAHITIVSDSKICVMTFTEWADTWAAKGTIKENMDLITPTHALYKQMRAITDIRIMHMRGHSKGTESAFYKCGNNLADKLCTEILAATKIT